MSEWASISLKVVEKVAEREGTDPTELHPPLHNVVNTEALDALFRSTQNRTRANGTVEFEYQGYKIRIDGSGEIQIGETVSFTESPAQPTEEKITDC